VLPNGLAFELTRQKNRRFGEYVYRQTRTNPDRIRRRLLSELAKHLPKDQIDAHFTPSYNPWDQRVCLVPDADLFEAIKAGKADVVTDTIERFTETGIQLDSGTHVDADIIVTATGLNLVTIGEMDLDIDGEKIDFSELWTYKGLGYSEIPNLISVFGYINASWTLRADLIVEYGCRLLNHMRNTGTDTATPRLRPSDLDMPRRPFIDDFPAGYMQRMMPMLPKQGNRAPWLNTQSVSEDMKLIGKEPVDDGVMVFG
jgi:cation diffusion facilitator CzcD-associated flavoprotein CzcO